MSSNLLPLKTVYSHHVNILWARLFANWNQKGFAVVVIVVVIVVVGGGGVDDEDDDADDENGYDVDDDGELTKDVPTVMDVSSIPIIDLIMGN